jgi:GSCFA family protein/polysaccharide biosynthesis acetyltransferase WcbI-like protein
MNVYMIGNCQTTVLTRCLALMNPALRIIQLDREADIATATTADDLILFQHLEIYPVPATNRRLVPFPTLYFNAFHPDLVQVRGPDGYVSTPLAGCHSSLALYGWQRGLSVDRTLRLFAEPVFEHLGFYRFWETSRYALLAAAEAADLPLERELDGWSRSGCFMHTMNHPKLRVFVDLARAVARRAGIDVRVERPEDYLADPMLSGPVWPVYPPVAQRLALRGSYLFKPYQPADADPPALLDLESFVAASYAVYARYDRAALVCPRLDDPAYRDLEQLTRPAPKRSDAAPAQPRANGSASPYAGLADFQFWRRAVERVDPHELDPFAGPPLPIDRRTKIATAGSCFAQHVSSALAHAGYNYFVAEPAPVGMSADAARRAQYGIFSARYGNLYTARQLLQLFDRAYGTFEPNDVAWLRPDGRFADPFRPEFEPGGFASIEDLVAARRRHFRAVRDMFERLDTFVFTLGLTEAWRSVADGAVFPLAPGVSAGFADPSEYEFHNFSTAEVVADLTAFLERLAVVNPAANVVLTVSPVPLIATYEPRHVLVSTTASKAVLRAAADEIERAHRNVVYFPAYEIVTGAFNRGAYVEADLRSPAPEGVEHVMRVFVAHCRDAGERTPAAAETLLEEIRRGMEVVCDEEKLAYG